MLDQFTNGYNTVVKVLGNIGGNVLIEDTSTGTTGGRSFVSTQWTLAYPDNTITGDVTFSENSPYGYSFPTSKYDIGNVGGNFLFESVIDHGHQSFDVSTSRVTSVGGDLSLLSNSFGSFSENSFTVTGDIGGNVKLLDTATNGHSFCCGSYWNFLGTTQGSLSVRDETPGTVGGRTVYNGNFEIGTVVGDAEFVEMSQKGISFASCVFEIGTVNGNLLFDAHINNGGQAFDVSTWNIGTVGKNLSVLSSTFGAFSEGAFTITEVKGVAEFIGTATYDFYSTDINIETCPHVIIRTTGEYSIYDSHNIFGSGVGYLNVIAEGGTLVTHSALFNARAATEVNITCLNDANCNTMRVDCPIDNKQNLCRVFCESTASCNNVDLYTTNGYCLDASFHCIDTGCSIATSSQVFCTVGTTYQYAQSGTYCYMTSDASGSLYCLDAGAAQCSEEAYCSGTPHPTERPTQNPTTKEPTIGPTPRPTTTAPTPNPTTNAPTNHPTYEPCSITNDPYNVHFVIDESGSVNNAGENNYDNTIDFIQDLIRNDVNSNSKVASMAFSQHNDHIYEFTDAQNDNRAGVLAALELERSDYVGSVTDTYNAIKEAVAMFEADTTITSSDNNLLFFFTDGRPYCGGDVGCYDTICTNNDRKNELLTLIQNKGITLYIIGIGNFDAVEITCLTDQNNIYLITGFTHEDFKSLEAQFRTILCPGQEQISAKTNEFNPNTNINPNSPTILNWRTVVKEYYPIVLITAGITGTFTIAIILVCWFGCFAKKSKHVYSFVSQSGSESES